MVLTQDNSHLLISIYVNYFSESIRDKYAVSYVEIS